MAGQAHHFLHYAPNLDPPADLPYAKDRYKLEVQRLYRVLDNNLKDRDFIAGNFFSIADMAIWPWVSLWRRQEQDITRFPHINDWLKRCSDRPSVQKGRDLMREKRSKIEHDKEAQKILFSK